MISSSFALSLQEQASIFKFAPHPWQSPLQSSLQRTLAGILKSNVCSIISTRSNSCPSNIIASSSSNSSSSKPSLTKKPCIEYSIGTSTSSKHLEQLSRIVKSTLISRYKPLLFFVILPSTLIGEVSLYVLSH